MDGTTWEQDTSEDGSHQHRGIKTILCTQNRIIIECIITNLTLAQKKVTGRIPTQS